MGVTRSTLTPKIYSSSSARETKSNPIGFSNSTKISTSLYDAASPRTNGTEPMAQKIKNYFCL